MNKNLYLSIIPIGKVDWSGFLEQIILTANINDNGFKCCRLFDQLNGLENIKIEDMPVFIPYEAINVNDGIKLRIALSYPINTDICESKYKNIKVLTPWHENEIVYEDAQWDSTERMIKDHSDYTIIVKDKWSQNIEEINKVLDICIKYNKPFKVCDNVESFQEIYDYFVK